MVRVSQIVSGSVAGAGAFLLGLLITFVAAGAAATRLPGLGSFGGSVPEWKATLWLFYDAHFVGTRTVELFGPDGSLLGGGELIDTVRLLDVEYLFLVPIIVLALFGAAIASRLDCADGRQGMIAGMSLIFGYLPLVILGLLLAVHFGTGPSPLRAVVIAGLVYPVFFGAVGGFISGHFSPNAVPIADGITTDE